MDHENDLLQERTILPSQPDEPCPLDEGVLSTAKENATPEEAVPMEGTVPEKRKPVMDKTETEDRELEIPEGIPENTAPRCADGQRNIPNSYPNMPYGVPNVPYGEPNMLYSSYNGSYDTQNPPSNQGRNPYTPGYYQQSPYGNPYYPGQNGNGNYPPMAYGAGNSPVTPVKTSLPKAQKNQKPVLSLVFGLVAMGVVNFFPFVALIVAVVAVCMGYAGLQKDGLTGGKKTCGIIGLSLGAVALTLSIAMLFMLLSLSIQVMRQ